MANCNCNDFPISCAPHAPGGDCCHPHGCPPHPCPPPPFKGGTSMYIGARYVPIFADPVEWDDAREYEPLTIVIHDGSCYTSKCYVPKGAQLPPYPEGQTKYWVKTSDYNYQFADLKKTVLDLSRLVEQFQKDNKAFTDLINGWNEKVQQWETDITAWGERLDTVESNITDLTASLNAEIDRAKAAEQANAAAIAQETADRKQAISELDAADAAEAQAREEADTALSNRITANKTDIDALKAEQTIQNTNISKNAKNISDNSAEIAKHAARLTSLESNASDWDDVFPNTTIAQEVKTEELARANADTALNGRCDTIAANVEEVRDIANHKVDTTTYTEEQAAQDAEIKKNTDEIKKNTDEINIIEGWQNSQDSRLANIESDIGDWKTDHPNQTISQCATSVENEIAAVDTKADANAANIGDWNTQNPGKTISQKVTDLSNSIPDVSGFVTETVYNQGQTAQDAKISEAKAAADKANTNIGDWETDHPGQTISQAVTDVNYLAFLDELYPENAVIHNVNFDDHNLIPQYFSKATTISAIFIPITVPYIVDHFKTLWQTSPNVPHFLLLYNSSGTQLQTLNISATTVGKNNNIDVVEVHFDNPYTTDYSGLYFFKFSHTAFYNWVKNERKFTSQA